MKLKRKVLDKAPVVLSVDYGNKLTLWVQVLMRIDAKVNLCKGKAPKKKSAKKTEITSINKGSQFRGPFLFLQPLCMA